MTDTELVNRGRRIYEQILSIPFSQPEMLAFGQAVFSKTPWAALTSSGKIAMFRFAVALASQAEESPLEPPGSAAPPAVASTASGGGDADAGEEPR